MSQGRSTARAGWRRLLGAIALTALHAAPALAADDPDFPRLDFVCPGALAVRAEPGGPVYINAQRATLKRYSGRYYEARGSAATVAIEVGADGGTSLSTLGPNRARSACRNARMGASPPLATPAAPVAPTRPAALPPPSAVAAAGPGPGPVNRSAPASARPDVRAAPAAASPARRW